MKKINTMEEFNEVKHLLPDYVLKDINKRIDDWKSSNGKLDDPYIRQQFRYAERFLNK